MPQEEVKAMSTANTVREGGKVRPQEPIKIYGTGPGHKAGAHLGALGEEHTVHAVLAHKLIASGAATLEPPTEGEKKADVKPEKKAAVKGAEGGEEL